MKHHRWILAALLGVPAILVCVYAHEWLAVDSALDWGASYDYHAGRADSSQDHPYVPFIQRHRGLVQVASVSLAGAICYGFVVFVVQRRSHAV